MMISIKRFQKYYLNENYKISFFLNIYNNKEVYIYFLII